MNERVKRIILAILASLVLVCLQIMLSSLFPLYGATPGTMIGSVVFLSVLFTKRGFSWMSAVAFEWRLICGQFAVLLLSRAMSSYHQNWVCETSKLDFSECLDLSGTLAKFGDGIGTLILVALTIWLLVHQPINGDNL